MLLLTLTRNLGNSGEGALRNRRLGLPPKQISPGYFLNGLPWFGTARAVFKNKNYEKMFDNPDQFWANIAGIITFLILIATGIYKGIKYQKKRIKAEEERWKEIKTRQDKVAEDLKEHQNKEAVFFSQEIKNFNNAIENMTNELISNESNLNLQIGFINEKLGEVKKTLGEHGEIINKIIRKLDKIAPNGIT